MKLEFYRQIFEKLIYHISSKSVQWGTWSPLAPCTMNSGSSPALKRPGPGVGHPTPSSADVKNG